MKAVTPSVEIIGRPSFDWIVVAKYLHDELGHDGSWPLAHVHDPQGQSLIEFMARLCYRSFEAGLNPNVTKVRTSSADYFENILKSRHGSVLAHAHYSFVFHNVSRVFTHEIVRHSAGTDISQESLRYVRLDDIKFWIPDWAREHAQLMARSHDLLLQMEEHQRWMAKEFGLDDPATPFEEKKAKTSFMRRFAPEGLATTVGMTFNVRALRHVLETRYSEHAEEEMRLVMPMLFQLMRVELPLLFNDYAVTPAGGLDTPYRKV